MKGDAILAIGGVTVLREERSPEGVPLLSLDLNDAAGNSLLRIQENSLSIEDLALWDIHLSGQPDSLDCAAQEGFALDLRFSRPSLEEFKIQIESDEVTSMQAPALDRLSRSRGMSPELTKQVRTFRAPPLVDFILAQAKASCLDTDGKVCLVDIENASLYGGGKLLKVRNGLYQEGSVYVFSHSFDNPGAAFSL